MGKLRKRMSFSAVANTLVHGGDYLKIGPVLLEDTGGRVDVSVVNLGNKNKYRGAIAAVQVAVPVPTTFTVTATSEGQGTVAIGQGTPGATVSVALGRPLGAADIRHGVRRDGFREDVHAGRVQGGVPAG